MTTRPARSVLEDLLGQARAARGQAEEALAAARRDLLGQARAARGQAEEALAAARADRNQARALVGHLEAALRTLDGSPPASGAVAADTPPPRGAPSAGLGPGARSTIARGEGEHP